MAFMFQCSRHGDGFLDGIFKDLSGHGECPECGILAGPAGAANPDVYRGHYNEGLGQYVGSRGQEKDAIKRIEDRSKGKVTLEECSRDDARSHGLAERRQKRTDKIFEKAGHDLKRELWLKGVRV